MSRYVFTVEVYTSTGELDPYLYLDVGAPLYDRDHDYVGEIVHVRKEDAE